MWSRCPGGHQPDPADNYGQQRGAGQQHPVSPVVAARLTGGAADDRGKDRHGRHRPGPECSDVCHRGHACRKRERGDHAKKMRAARDAVQDA